MCQIHRKKISVTSCLPARKGACMQDIFGEQLKAQRNYLHKIIKEKREALEGAPEGRLRCKKNHDRQEYYCVTDCEDMSGRYLLADEKELVLSKIRAYDKSGYFLGDNLILTFETKNLPLDTREIDRIIHHFLI